LGGDMPTRTPGATSLSSAVADVAPNLAGESRQTVLRTNTVMTLARPSSTSLRAWPTSAEVKRSTRSPSQYVHASVGRTELRRHGQAVGMAELRGDLPDRLAQAARAVDDKIICPAPNSSVPNPSPQLRISARLPRCSRLNIS